MNTPVKKTGEKGPTADSSDRSRLSIVTFLSGCPNSSWAEQVSTVHQCLISGFLILQVQLPWKRVRQPWKRYKRYFGKSRQLPMMMIMLTPGLRGRGTRMVSLTLAPSFPAVPSEPFSPRPPWGNTEQPVFMCLSPSHTCMEGSRVKSYVSEALHILSIDIH